MFCHSNIVTMLALKLCGKVKISLKITSLRTHGACRKISEKSRFCFILALAKSNYMHDIIIMFPYAFHFPVNLDPVDTYPDICENGGFSLRFSETENRGFQKRSPEWMFSKTPFLCLRMDGRKRRFSKTINVKSGLRSL